MTRIKIWIRDRLDRFAAALGELVPDLSTRRALVLHAMRNATQLQFLVGLVAVAAGLGFWLSPGLGGAVFGAGLIFEAYRPVVSGGRKR